MDEASEARSDFAAMLELVEAAGIVDPNSDADHLRWCKEWMAGPRFDRVALVTSRTLLSMIDNEAERRGVDRQSIMDELRLQAMEWE